MTATRRAMCSVPSANPSNDYLLDCYAREISNAYRTKVETEYEPDVDDATEGIRDELKTWMVRRDLVPFGTVH